MPEPRVLIVELDLPPKACSPNRSGHWAKHSGDYAAYKAVCATKIRRARNENGDPVLERAIVSYVFFLARRPGRKIPDGLYRPRDEDNAIGCMKPFQDALTVSGLLLSGDSHRRVRIGGIELLSRKKEHMGRAGVVATITEVIS